MDRRHLIGIMLVVVSACGFGSGALFAKPVYAAGVDWLTLLVWRFVIGAALAWGWLLLSAAGRRGLRLLTRREVLVAIALGILYTGNSGTYYAGLETVPASLAALIVYIYPALVAVLSLRVGRRLEGRRAWAALGLALLGVALAVGGIDATEAPPPLGLLLIVASPIIYAVWIVLAARLSGERSDRVGREAEQGAQTAAATALMMTATAGAWLVLATTTERPYGPALIPSEAWPGILGVAVLATFVAIVAFYAGARRVGAAQAALISTVEPIWTITLAAILFGELLQPVQLLGGALIIGGVLLAQWPTGASMPLRPRIRIADE